MDFKVKDALYHRKHYMKPLAETRGTVNNCLNAEKKQEKGMYLDYHFL